MRLALSILCLIGSISSCTSKMQNTHASHFNDGRAKPIVAIVPYFDRSNTSVGWNISDEFNHLIQDALIKKNSFYLTSPTDISLATVDLTASQNPFSNDFGWVKDTFENNEYVVFTEIVEHDIHPRELKGTYLDVVKMSYELTATVRVRVFDLRGREAEVVLQELLHKNYPLPKSSSFFTSQPDRWKRFFHAVSPIGIAHAKINKEIVDRVENYIMISKSN